MDGGCDLGELRLAHVGLRHPTAVVPAVSTPAAYTALDALDALDALNALDALDTLDALGTLDTLDALDALDTLGTLASERSVLGDAGRRERGRGRGL